MCAAVAELSGAEANAPAPLGMPSRSEKAALVALLDAHVFGAQRPRRPALGLTADS
jgi:hypothetical protein